jgi:aspartate ammonia-lyase
MRTKYLANIALEMSGHKKGEYQFVEPHDDLNMGQSTNDVYPDYYSCRAAAAQ